MAPFIARATTDEAFAAALEVLGVTAEELLACDDLADILRNKPAGKHWVCAIRETRSFRDRWQPGRLATLQPMAPIVLDLLLADLVVVVRQTAGTTAELVKPNSQQPWKRSASLQRSFLHAGFWQTGTVAEDVVTVNDVTRHSCGCRHQRWCDPQH